MNGSLTRNNKNIARDNPSTSLLHTVYTKQLRKKKLDGFTLIEILIAILIFGVAFVSFFGIQSAALKATALSRDRFDAMLIAKNILSYIEIAEDEITNVNTDGSINDLSRSLSKGVIKFDPEMVKKYKAKLNIGFFKFQGIDNDALRKISLTVYWGPNPEQSIDVDYFIPKCSGCQWRCRRLIIYNLSFGL